MRKLKGIIINGEYLGNKVAYSGLFRAIYCISPVIIAEFIKLVSDYGTRYAPLRITGFDLPEDHRIVIRFANKKYRGYADLSFAVENFMLKLIDSDVQVIPLLPEKHIVEDVEAVEDAEIPIEETIEESEETQIEESESEVEEVQPEIIEEPEEIKEPIEDIQENTEQPEPETVAVVIPMPETAEEEEPVEEVAEENIEEPSEEPTTIDKLVVEEQSGEEVLDNEETLQENASEECLEETLEENINSNCESVQDSEDDAEQDFEQETAEQAEELQNYEKNIENDSDEEVEFDTQNEQGDYQECLTEEPLDEIAETADSNPGENVDNDDAFSTLEEPEPQSYDYAGSEDVVEADDKYDSSDSDYYEESDDSEEEPQSMADEDFEAYADNTYDTNNTENYSDEMYQEPDEIENYNDSENNIEAEIPSEIESSDETTNDDFVNLDENEQNTEEDDNSSIEVKEIIIAKSKHNEEDKPIKTIDASRLDPDTLAEIQDMLKVKKKEAPKTQRVARGEAQSSIKMVAPSQKKGHRPFKMFQKGKRTKVTVLDENSFLVGDTIYKWGDVFYVDG